MSEEPTKPKSSIIKKWYFWVIIVIIAFVMLAQKAMWDAETETQDFMNIMLN